MNVVFSENPEGDLWRELLQYSYEANISRYLSKKGIESNASLLNCISGSFLQAFEYYRSARNADIQIAPLLLYYGSTNLLYGMVTLINGSNVDINHHGMILQMPDKMDYIADVGIHFVNPKEGGVHVFAKALGVNQKLTDHTDWKLKDFLDSIAEINSNYLQCYGAPIGKIIMLDAFNTPDGKAEKVYYGEENEKSILDLLGYVEGFNQSYLHPQMCEDYETKQKYYVLRHKYNGEEICEKAFSGQPYLRAGHKKGKTVITLPTILNMYIALFALASLCRYHPEKWSPFVTKDSTGEKLLVEKLLYYARRMIPNYVLDILVGDRTVYSSNVYSEKNTIKHVGEHQIQELIDQKLRNHIEQQQIRKDKL